MLDQNTDRMWYVIGAVIIGAAIIFLMNSSFPQLFASVGETFGNKTEDVSKDIGSIRNVDNHDSASRPTELNQFNLVDMSNIETGLFSYSSGLNMPDDYHVHDKFERMKNPIPIKPNTKYYISHGLTNEQPEGVEIAWAFYDESKQMISGSRVYGGHGYITTPKNAAFMRVRYGNHVTDWSTRDYYLAEYSNVSKWIEGGD